MPHVTLLFAQPFEGVTVDEAMRKARAWVDKNSVSAEDYVPRNHYRRSMFAGHADVEFWTVTVNYRRSEPVELKAA